MVTLTFLVMDMKQFVEHDYGFLNISLDYMRFQWYVEGIMKQFLELITSRTHLLLWYDIYTTSFVEGEGIDSLPLEGVFYSQFVSFDQELYQQ